MAFGRFAFVWPVFGGYMGAYTIRSVWRRGAVEDGMMYRKFGDEWLEYRRNVPYKFFPYLI